MTDSNPSEDGHTPPSKAKDPTRPKRKKARRACLACQRAHLTCGDERPCQRCIKRGLQDACHDGMRKKAKYLHDAPNEALMPGAGETYHLHKDTNHEHDQISPSTTQSPSLTAPNDGSQLGNPVSFDVFNRPSGERSMGPPPSEQVSFPTYAAQNSPMSTRLHQSPSFQHDVNRAPDPSIANVQTHVSNFYDSNDSSFFNFDLASMNFGNHYGALEFGILGHLSSGANDNLVHANQHRHSSASYDAPNISSLGFPDDTNDVNNYGLNIGTSLADWQSNPLGHGLQMNPWNTTINHPDLSLRHQTQSEPHGYSIGAATALSAMSPDSSGPDGLTPHERGYSDVSMLSNPQPSTFEREQYRQFSQSQQPPPYMDNGPSETIAKRLGSLPAGTATMRKRRRNPSMIYSSVTKPYPYTQGFHALTELLQRRVSQQKRLAIAHSLGSIRPSFISCMRGLVDDDLVFMEKCFQRQLVEYEDYINACGTPTIVCRRTGEVAYAGKEFSLMTGWSKDVLLGKAPNLNVNGIEPASGSMTGTSSRTGFNTPRLPPDAVKSEGADDLQAARPQAVFLAELLDADSLVQFYEDFAKLAFADSMGNAWERCKLLRYKTKDDPSMKALLDSHFLDKTIDPSKEQYSRSAVDQNPMRRTQGNSMHGYVGNETSNLSSSRSATGPEKLQHKTKVDCMYCWTVRRDVFNIPMMIVINFLPLIEQL